MIQILLSNLLQKKEITDYKCPRQLITNGKWNSVIITKDEHSSLITYLTYNNYKIINNANNDSKQFWKIII